MNADLQDVFLRMLANHERIGPSVWELAVLIVYGPQIGTDRIAEKIGKDRRTVSRNLRHLEQAGIIERQRIPGKANSYVVRLDK